MCEHCTRRQFLGAGATASVLLASGAIRTTAAQTSTERQQKAKVPICVIFAGLPGPEDRGWNVDPKQLQQIQDTLKQIEQKLGNVHIVSGTARSAAEAAQLLEKAGDNAPVLAVIMHIGSLLRIVQPILDAKRPMLVFALPASGHDWMYPPRWQQSGQPVTLFATSDYAELERAVRLLRVLPLMKQSRILLFPPARGTEPARSPEQVKERLGCEVVVVEQKEFDDLLEKADEKAVEAEAKRWTENAQAIIEPTKEDIWKAARVSVVLDQLVRQYDAQGLAVGTCMGWLPRGFPCLGFSRLRDRGIPAACEGDMDSLLTMMLFQHAFGLPGFQGNATFDTAKNALWTAHCTAPLKMDGPDGPEAPYLLRGHSEVGGSGCVPEVHYRIGQPITRAKLINLDTILLSTAEIIEVPEKAIHGCRSQIVSRVRDASKMMFNWGGGVLDGDMMTLLHRVVFFGDHSDSVYHLARLMGMQVVEEG